MYNLKVVPGEIENIIRSHSQVSYVAVVGVKDERLGEAPRAYIVPRDISLCEKDIEEYMKDKISAHKQLAGGVQFVDVIPKSMFGKILRRILSDKYEANQ